MINGKIDVAKGFQTSINIALDLNNDEKVSNFIPTLSSFDIIEEIMLSVSPTSTERARLFVGAYGRGKSHIILVIMSLLYRKDRALFKKMLAKMKVSNSNMFDYITEFLNSERKLLPIIVRGSSISLTQSFLNSLQQTLNSEGLEDIMPETNFTAAINAIDLWHKNYPETYVKFLSSLDQPVEDFIVSLKEYDVSAYEKFVELYPSLTSGSTFHPFVGMDVIALYEHVVEKLKEKGFDGVYVVYDEFSKYLEASIASATISDIKLLQDFAEKCNRSGENQIHLMLVCHKDIANYINKNLPKDKVDGWRGVSGRFKQINLSDNFSQIYEIISAAIKKEPVFWDEFCRINKKKFEDFSNRFTANGLLDAKDVNAVRNAVIGCYPLHPISTFILPRLSEKVAQNERTLFTFLSSGDRHTLSEFINNAEGDFPLLTPDYIYDYFESLIRKEPYTSEIFELYLLTTKILERVESDSLEARIIKTISLIYIVEDFWRLPPTNEIIINAFQDITNNTQAISDALINLMNKKCIVYLKRSNNYLKLKDSSGVDIPKEITKVIEEVKKTESVKDILNAMNVNNYMYPTKYNDKHEITRYFDVTFINSTEFLSVDSWNLILNENEADGIVYAIIPNSSEEIALIRKSLLTGKSRHNRVVFILPKYYIDIAEVAYEYRAIQHLRSLVIEEDQLLKDEYDIYIEDLDEVINSFILSYLKPESNGSEYYYNGQRMHLLRKAQLSNFLSTICEETFPYTPRIVNEAINKNYLPTTAINSRAKILSGLLGTEFEANLGLTGTGQDVSIMRSTLVRTGILANIDTTPVLNMNPPDKNLSNVLQIISDFFTKANNEDDYCFEVLYNRLTSPEHGIGLKRGVIPIYIAAVLHLYKQNLVVVNNGNEMKINADLLNSINEKPENYNVILEGWSNEKTEYIKGLEELFYQHIVENEKSYNNFTYIVFAMNRWYMSLPKYSKEIDKVYSGNKVFQPLPIDSRRFINSLKIPDINPRQYLFEKIFSIFGMEDFDLKVLSYIKNAKYYFDNAVSSLIKVLIDDVKNMFIGSYKEGISLTSVIKDWLESLGDATTQFLFPNNENEILDYMLTISNDEIDFIRGLCKRISYLRIEDWNGKTINTFIDDLKRFKDTVENFNQKHVEGTTIGAEMYSLVFTDSEGNKVVKSFYKADYSKRAKLLLNEISTSLDEMGQSITEQEKRQVLIELLERLC